MSRIIINGTLSPIRQPVEYDFDPVRGLVGNVSYKGGGWDSLVGLANYCISHRIAFRWRRGPISSLEMTYSGGQGGLADYPQTNYELLGNEIQRHIYESAIALAGLAAYPSLIADVKYGWSLIEAGDAAAETEFSADLESGEGTYYDTLIGFLERGQTHFAQGQYVCKRTISISNFYYGSMFDESYAEHILSTGTLLSACSDMPPVMSQRISGIASGTNHTGYVWGWRQLPSRMATSAQNRVEVSTEWWYSEWSTVHYGSLL